MTTKIANLKALAPVKKVASRIALKADKYSPEILLGVGIVGIVGATVLACKATLSVKPLIDEHKETVQNLKEYWADEENQKEDQGSYKKDLTMITLKTGIEVAKKYAPSVAVGALSVACIVSGHNIQARRYVAVTAAYNGLQEAFKSYQKRVSDEFGEEKEKEIRLGTRHVSVTEEEVDENGKKKKVKKDQIVADKNHVSRYARYFDESSSLWQKDAEYNLLFLRSAQNQMNDRLQRHGHLFLNEVYDYLGLPRTKEGAVVGWVLGAGDDYVDFGIYDILNERARDFVNGYERCILLDFNVDGLIYDLI